MRLEDERVEGGLGDTPKIAACAALLAAQHANERNGSVVPELARSGEPLHLVPIPINIRADVPTAILGFLGVRTRIDGMVDGAASRTNVHVAQLGAIDGVPQLSFYSSAPELSGARFSHFGRSFASDVTSAGMLAAALADFGWRHFGVLHVRDEWASGFSAQLAQHAYTLGLTQYASSWTESDESEIEQAIAMIRGTRVNVILFVCFELDLEPLLRLAEAAGLLAPRYVWIAIEGLIHVEQANVAVDPTTARLLRGMLSFEANPEPTRGFQRLARLWTTLGPADCARAGAEGNFEVPSSAFAQPPTAYAAFAYDAVAALALGLRSSSNPHDGAEVLDAVRAVRFNGSSGPVTFDAALDRHASGLVYTLSRFVETAEGSVEAAGGSMGGQHRLALRICHVIAGDAVDTSTDGITTVPLLFRDNTASAPEDAIVAYQRALDEQSAHQRRLIVALTSAFGALLLLFFAMMYNTSRNVREFKRREIDANKVLEAIRGVHRLDHPCVLVTATDFVALGRLVEHEELRAAGKLIFYDTPQQIQQQQKHVVFFSQYANRGAVNCRARSRPLPLHLAVRCCDCTLRICLRPCCGCTMLWLCLAVAVPWASLC